MTLAAQWAAFAPTVTIISKDGGPMRYRPYGTQRYLTGELLRGIQEGIHDFWVLKARQVGASTAAWVFDAFWCLRHKGIQGELIADDEPNKEFARDVFTEMVKTIPAKYSYPVRQNNRVQVAWANGSRLLYQIAGTKPSQGKRVGRSRGLNYIHGTEVAYWGNPETVDSLYAAMSESHPYRCAIWETTANGFNHFHERFEVATRARTSRTLFIAWWRHELYRVRANSKVYQVYWDGTLTSEEAAWQREITRQWQVTLAPEQWAWYRWRFVEKHRSDPLIMHQEFPTLPQHAFQASGQSFLGAAVMARLRESLDTAPSARAYRYSFGPTIESCRLEDTSAPLAELRVWEEPVEGGKGHYIIAADPAYGRGAEADRSAITVWRARRDRLSLVAQYLSDEVTQDHFAWVCMHLCGAYQRAYHILEINGPGWGVLQEEQRLFNYGWGTARQAEIQNVLGSIQHYIYRRPDSLGSSGALQWMSNDTRKAACFARLRALVTDGRLVIPSPELVAELGTVRQEGEVFEAQGRAHDDLAMTAALACEMWSDQVLAVLQGDPEEYQSQLVAAPATAPPAHERAFQHFIDDINRRG